MEKFEAKKPSFPSAPVTLLLISLLIASPPPPSALLRPHLPCSDSTISRYCPLFIYSSLTADSKNELGGFSKNELGRGNLTRRCYKLRPGFVQGQHRPNRSQKNKLSRFWILYYVLPKQN
ncbi:hypothetical protein L2E82_29317 [Cichorium intybus]|uniref:Uncharacterized protein n=1 Tax=Cichorium intybus TaxID=13427 RepID=A0ACB9CXE1_CICIN|nr:hypothetical protein L2E82_29317 [Cichorium intybus]